MDERRVVITGATFPSDVVARLTKNGLSIITIPGDLGADRVRAALAGAWGYVLGGSERVPKQLWSTLPDLRVACFLGTGYHAFMPPADEPTAIEFTYTPYANASAVAEFTIALMLDLTRQVTARANDTVAGRWHEDATSSLVNGRLGIAGMGNVGRTVARMASAAFGTEIWYWNRSARPELDALGYRRADSILQLCSEVEMLTLNLNFEPGHNGGTIGATELKALGSAGILVNTARAELVDPAALREALLQDCIAAAAFDVYYQEPTPTPADDPFGLLALTPRMLVTPHCAYLTHEAAHRMAEMAADNLLAVAAGVPAPYRVVR
ncbi:2-hydroxyacid dehydrogenase [Actinoplanes sp. OR16]|uniref:2-hydroxyacid dehydrogenase n=1 Tax=Actinoplanes sp. OR16 TaxID=946334 RepID=UPI00135F1BF7|nr:NAD(P)-dependent oxidoreductase [Actinoplanes sp. OR16]